MILLSLLLVLVSLGLLIAGLAWASQVLVWASITASLLAGLCLAFAVLRRRPPEAEEDETRLLRSTVEDASTSAPATHGGSAVEDPAGSDHTTSIPIEPGPSASANGGRGGTVPVGGVWTDPRGVREAAPPVGPDHDAVPPEATGVSGPPGVPGAASVRGAAGRDRPAKDADYPDPPGEPPAEQVSATNALRLVPSAAAMVVVVDGRPRYHLLDCPHLAGRQAVSLPFSEAREAGFTPCSMCKPDTHLVQRAQASMTPRWVGPEGSPGGTTETGRKPGRL